MCRMLIDPPMELEKFITFLFRWIKVQIDIHKQPMAFARNAVVDMLPMIRYSTAVYTMHPIDSPEEGVGTGPCAIYYDSYEYDNGTTDTAPRMPNLCVECGTDLGYGNPRQLCGKFICDNPPLEDTSCEEDDGEHEEKCAAMNRTKGDAVALASGGKKLKVD